MRAVVASERAICTARLLAAALFACALGLASDALTGAVQPPRLAGSPSHHHVTAAPVRVRAATSLIAAAVSGGTGERHAAALAGAALSGALARLYRRRQAPSLRADPACRPDPAHRFIPHTPLSLPVPASNTPPLQAQCAEEGPQCAEEGPQCAGSRAPLFPILEGVLDAALLHVIVAAATPLLPRLPCPTTLTPHPAHPSPLMSTALAPPALALARLLLLLAATAAATSSSSSLLPLLLLARPPSPPPAFWPRALRLLLADLVALLLGALLLPLALAPAAPRAHTQGQGEVGQARGEEGMMGEEQAGVRNAREGGDEGGTEGSEAMAEGGSGKGSPKSNGEGGWGERLYVGAGAGHATRCGGGVAAGSGGGGAWGIAVLCGVVAGSCGALLSGALSASHAAPLAALLAPTLMCCATHWPRHLAAVTLALSASALSATSAGWGPFHHVVPLEATLQVIGGRVPLDDGGNRQVGESETGESERRVMWDDGTSQPALHTWHPPTSLHRHPSALLASLAHGSSSSSCSLSCCWPTCSCRSQPPSACPSSCAATPTRELLLLRLPIQPHITPCAHQWIPLYQFPPSLRFVA
ncbi:unnamed protein product [Closterium sp. NIES-54]